METQPLSIGCNECQTENIPNIVLLRIQLSQTHTLYTSIPNTHIIYIYPKHTHFNYFSALVTKNDSLLHIFHTQKFVR